MLSKMTLACSAVICLCIAAKGHPAPATATPTRNSDVPTAAPAAAPAEAVPATAGTRASDNWPSFRGTPDQRGLAGTTLSSNPELQWEVTSPDGWVGTCAIAFDHVYAPALHGFLHSFRLDNGEEVWRVRSIDEPDPKKFAPGFKAAPLVTEDTVYAGDEDGVLHAINRADGTLKWRFATGAEIAGCVAKFEDRLLLASHDSFLYCLSTDGNELWKFETNDRVNCSPAIAGNFTFLAGCDEHLRVIDLTAGTEARDIPLNSFLIASPAIVDDRLYVGTHAGDVVEVLWQTGETGWRYVSERMMPFHASAAVTDELVLVGGHDKLFHAIDRDTGTARWTFPTQGRIESSAAVVDDRVFFGSGDGNIYGLSLNDGREVWKYNTGKAVNAGVAIGQQSLIIGDDDRNGRLRCFR